MFKINKKIAFQIICEQNNKKNKQKIKKTFNIKINI